MTQIFLVPLKKPLINCRQLLKHTHFKIFPGVITMIRKLTVFMILVFFALPVCAQKMTAGEVVAKHLDSIGKAETRAGIQNLIVVGEVTQKFIVPKDLDVMGRAVLASAGPKNFFGMSLSNRGSEQFIFDGKKT